MTNAAIAINHNSKAIEAVKTRFVRVPSVTSYPRFKDLITGHEQGDAGILADYYYTCAGHTTVTTLGPRDLLEKLEWAYGDGFQPLGPKFLDGKIVNTWVPHTYQYSGAAATDEQVRLFLEYLERMFPVQEEREYMTWYIAHAIRRPDRKIIATPVLRSKQGIGKTFLVGNLMRNIMGVSADVCALGDIVGSFQDALLGKTMLLIDECYVDKRRTSNVLKPYQSNPTLLINRKGKPHITIDNKINFIIASNDVDPIYFESSDRRFFIPQFIEYKVDQVESKAFITRLVRWLASNDGRGYRLVRDWLESVDLSTYDANDPAIMTDSKQARMGWNLDDQLERQIAGFIAERKVVNTDLVMQGISVETKQTISSRRIAAQLELLGCISKRTDEGVFHITPLGIENGLNLSTLPKVLKEEFRLASGHCK